MKEAEQLKPVLAEVDRLCVGTKVDREKVMVILEQEELGVSEIIKEQLKKIFS